MRRFCLLFSLLLFVTCAAAAQTPCKPGLNHRKLDHKTLQNLQVSKVNTAKELWRLDADRLAEVECLTLEPLLKMRSASSYRKLRGDDHVQVFTCAPVNGRQFELTLKRPDWLLPYSGTLHMMMWVVTDVKTTCGK